MNIAIVAGLNDKKLMSKLEPLIHVDSIKNIYLIRRRPLQYPKVICYTPPGLLNKTVITAELYRLLALFYVCIFKHIDVVMGIYLFMHSIFAAVACKIFHKPFIINIIGGNEPYFLLNYRLFIYLLKYAVSIITRGVNTRQTLIDYGINAEKIYYIPNVFDFESVLYQQKYTDPEYDLVYVGAIERIKRIDILLAAFYTVVQDERFKDSYLAIVGDGPLMDKFKAQVQSLGIDRQVHFLGHRNQVYTVLCDARVFIMTSEQEGLPMAMIEAMACGLPCIVPDPPHSEINTVARHEHNALLVPPGDVDGFARSIKRLLADAPLYERLSQNARKIRDERAYEYSLENTVRIWTEIVNRLQASRAT